MHVSSTRTIVLVATYSVVLDGVTGYWVTASHTRERIDGGTARVLIRKRILRPVVVEGAPVKLDFTKEEFRRIVETIDTLWVEYTGMNLYDTFVEYKVTHARMGRLNAVFWRLWNALLMFSSNEKAPD